MSKFNILIIYFLSILLIYYLANSFTPLAKLIGEKYNIVDKPNHRKIHKTSVIRTGGIAITTTFFVSMSIYLILSRFLNFNFISIANWEITVILVSSFLFFLIGLIDDIFENFSAYLKLILELFISFFIWSQGIRIEYIDFSPIFNNSMHIPPVLSLIVTIIWITGVSNSINWLDGMNGLLSLFIINSSVGFLIISYLSNNQLGSILSVILIGISLSFFRTNVYKLNIFMGDAGSIFFGSLISLLAIIICGKNGITDTTIYLNNFNPIIAMTILALPIIDMTRVIFYRVSKGISPFYSDANHFHHYLARKGFHKDNILIIIFFITQITSFFGILSASGSFLIALYSLIPLPLLFTFLFYKNKRFIKTIKTNLYK